MEAGPGGTPGHPVSTSLMAEPGRDQLHSEKEGNHRKEKSKEDRWLVQTTGANLFVYCYSGFYKLWQGLYGWMFSSNDIQSQCYPVLVQSSLN